MSDKKRGLYRKFEVHRTDGADAPGQKHDGCRYFVLDLDHDPVAAAIARTTLADAYERAGYVMLAADLRTT